MYTGTSVVGLSEIVAFVPMAVAGHSWSECGCAQDTSGGSTAKLIPREPEDCRTVAPVREPECCGVGFTRTSSYSCTALRRRWPGSLLGDSRKTWAAQESAAQKGSAFTGKLQRRYLLTGVLILQSEP